MQVSTFIAETVADAVEKIRGDLGPEAIVLNVRRLPAEGVSRLWRKPRIEVLATLPERPSPDASPQLFLDELREEIAGIRRIVEAREPRLEPAATPSAALASSEPGCDLKAAPHSNGEYPLKSGILLERSGLAPASVHLVLDKVLSETGSSAGSMSLPHELRAIRSVLIDLWRPFASSGASTHVFLGPPGSGKTTVLCKWLAQATLVQGRPARVFRLDSHVANAAESLSVFAEILHVPVERFCPEEPQANHELRFVDLPGCPSDDRQASDAIRRCLSSFPGAQLHLVLNAAYENNLLLAQGRAFAGLLGSNADVIFSHIDEETRWGKLWNFVLGTNYSISHLSAGQNVPGVFESADPATILARQFPRN